MKREIVDLYCEGFNRQTGPSFFMNNCFHIVHPRSGVEPIKLYPKQQEVLNEIVTNNVILWDAARQVGKTVLGIGYIMWDVIFNHSYRSSLIASPTLNMAEGARHTFLTAWDHLPAALKPAITRCSRYEIAFNNGSVIYFDIIDKNTARGKTLHTIFLDEHDFAKDEEHIHSVLPSLASTNGKLISFSSINYNNESVFKKMIRSPYSKMGKVTVC